MLVVGLNALGLFFSIESGFATMLESGVAADKHSSDATSSLWWLRACLQLNLGLGGNYTLRSPVSLLLEWYRHFVVTA